MTFIVIKYLEKTLVYVSIKVKMLSIVKKPSLVVLLLERFGRCKVFCMLLLCCSLHVWYDEIVWLEESALYRLVCVILSDV